MGDELHDQFLNRFKKVLARAILLGSVKAETIRLMEPAFESIYIMGCADGIKQAREIIRGADKEGED